MKLLYLCLLSFVFIASCALALSGINNVSPTYNRDRVKVFSPLPVSAKDSPFPVLSAQAVLAVDLDSGVVLYEKDPDKELLPASTTKIITALVAMDTYPDDRILKVGKVKVDGQKMNLVEGEEISVSGLLNGLLIYSANDAAEVLAQNYTGGRKEFVKAMNLKTRELNLDNSNFSNPIGLDGGGNYTTARDLIRASEVGMRIPGFAKIVGTKDITVKSSDGKIAHRLVNINELLGKVPGVLGVKTGWTENARENLVTYIERDGHKVTIAILGSSDRFGETKELIDWIFANYKWKEVKLPNSYSP